MVDQRVIDYIKENLSRGISLEQIKQALINVGWQQEEVNSAIDFINQVTKPVDFIARDYKQNSSGKKSKKIILICIAIVIIFCLIFFLYPREISFKKEFSLSDLQVESMSLSPGGGPIIEGRYISLVSIGENDEITIEVDGVLETIEHSSKKVVNGVEIENVEIEDNGLAKIKVKVIEPKAETDEQDNQGDEEISAGDCGECQYLENHICVNYECCKNDDCQNNEICKIHECIKLNCGDRQYIKNHKCLDYECCEDSDCNDNDISTNDKCINPRTTSASCSNILTDKCYSNSDCDDEDVSTKDICSGTPKKCSNTKITQCINGDNYCPSGCTHNNDDDCEIQVIDCGSNLLSIETVGNMPNFDCFIEASENCYPAKLLNTATMEIFGTVPSSTTLMELKGIESGKCIYYQRIESYSVRFSDETVQQMLDSGITQEEIDEQEQIATDNVQEVVGMQKTCKFNTEDLTAVLNKWKEGSFSSGTTSCKLKSDGTSECTTEGGDFGAAECEGDY